MVAAIAEITRLELRGRMLAVRRLAEAGCLCRDALRRLRCVLALREQHFPLPVEGVDGGSIPFSSSGFCLFFV